eukprot:342831_1
MIQKKGLNILVSPTHTHEVHSIDITCEYMKNTSDNPNNCPIYKAMLISHKFSWHNFKHMYEFTHFKDEFKNKPICNDNQQCESFIRLEKGGNKMRKIPYTPCRMVSL